MYTQLPQIRAQMQAHADQMGIAQGRLNLDQQETEAKIPVYGAQTKNYNAEAGYRDQQANQLAQLIQFAQQASQADPNRLTAALTGAGALDATSAARMRNDITKPLLLNQNQTAFGNPQTGAPTPLAQGVVNAPFGNTVMQGTQLGGTNQPSVIQQGQFRPPGSMNLDPSTAALNFGKLAEILDNLGGGTNEITALLQAAQQRATGGAQPTASGTNTVPPANQRQAGQTYQTPKGPLKWTGTGWVTP